MVSEKTIVKTSLSNHLKLPGLGGGTPVRPNVATDGERLKLVICIVAIVFSTDMALGDAGIDTGRYLDLPIEALAILGLSALPLFWSRHWLLSLLLMCVLGSALFSGTFLSGLRYVAIASFGAYLLPTLYEKCAWKESVFATTIQVIALVLGVVVLLNPYNSSGRYDLWHAYPFTGSKLTAGLVFSVAICVSLTQMTRSRGKARAFNVGVLIWSLCLILLLESRAPLFSLAGALALFAYRKNLRGLPVLVVTGVVLLGLFATVVDKDSNAYRRVQQRYIETDPFDNASFRGRVASWQNYAAVARDCPFGVGFERSMYEFEFGRESHRQMSACGAHSEFLKLLVELGWAPFLVLCMLNVRALSSCVRPRVSAEREPLHMMFSMMLVTLLPQLLVNNEMQHPEVGILYWFAMGTLLRLDQTSSKRIGVPPRMIEQPKRHRRSLAGIAPSRGPAVLATGASRKQWTRPQ